MASICIGMGKGIVSGTKEGGSVIVAFQMHRKAAPLFEMERETGLAIDETSSGTAEGSVVPCRGRDAGPSGRPSCSRDAVCNDEVTGVMQHCCLSNTSLRISLSARCGIVGSRLGAGEGRASYLATDGMTDGTTSQRGREVVVGD